MQRGNTRNPPPWASEIEAVYPFRHWLMDCIAWCMSTDEPENRKAFQIEFALGGIARELVREIALETKRDGANVDLGDGQGLRHRHQ